MISAHHNGGPEHDSLSNLSAYISTRSFVVPETINHRVRVKNKKLYYILYDFNDHRYMEKYQYSGNDIDYKL